MHPSRPRIAPVADVTTLDDESRELLSATETAQTVNIFRTLVRHPKLLKRWTVFANHILFKSSLPLRDRELLILRVGWLCHAEYEWSQHVLIAQSVGISDEEIERVIEGPDAPGWSGVDAALLRAADELHAESFVGDSTWNALAERYSEQQLMDLVFTVGQYTLVSMALNSFGVELEAGLEGFPA